MNAIARLLPAALFVALVGFLGAPLVAAQTEDWKAMRSAGQLGERYDGFLEARDTDAAPAADRINKARRELYEKRAAEIGASTDEVGRVYFNKNLEQLPPGTWLHLENGDWVRK